MEFWEALALVFGTLVSVLIGLYVFRKPIDEFIQRHDKKRDNEKALTDNNEQTEQNRTNIERLANEFKDWRNLTESRLEKGTLKMNVLEKDVKEIKDELATNNTLLTAMNAKLDLLVEDRIYSPPTSKNSEILKEVHEENIKRKLSGGGQN